MAADLQIISSLLSIIASLLTIFVLVINRRNLNR